MNIKERHKTGLALAKTVTPSAMHDALMGCVRTLAYEMVAASAVTYLVGFIFADKITKDKKETEEK